MFHAHAGRKISKAVLMIWLILSLLLTPGVYANGDTTPPETYYSGDFTRSSSPSVPPREWMNFTSGYFLANDDSLGPILTKYRINGGSWITDDGSVLRFDQEGEYLLEWYSTDAAGNTEAVKSALLKIDHTPPITTRTITSGGVTGERPEYNEPVTVSLVATDSLSGTGSGFPMSGNLWYRVNDGGWHQLEKNKLTLSFAVSGTHKIEYYARDIAGNYEATQTLMLNVKLDDSYQPGAFVKGINFHGGTTVIEGNHWLAESAAGITTSSIKRYISNRTFQPTVDNQTNEMLNQSIYASSSFTVNQPLANGTYDIYLWAAENYQSFFRSFHVHFENQKVTENPIGSMPMNEWRKYGPYRVTVQDGQLNMELSKVTGDPTLSGMAIYAAGNNPPPIDDIAPSVPQNLKVSAKDSTGLTITWDASSDNVGVVHYEILRSNVHLVGMTSATQFTLSGLMPDENGYVTIRARDAAGNVSASSQQLYFRMDEYNDITPPSVPTNLTVIDKTHNTVTISWDASTDNVGVDHYDIFIERISDQQMKKGTAYSTNRIFYSLQPNTTYRITVAAADPNSNRSAESEPVFVTTDLAPWGNGAGDPNFIKGVNFSGSEVMVEGNLWQAESLAGVTSMGVKRYISTRIFEQVGDIPTNSMLNSSIYNDKSFSVKQSLPNGTYHIYLWTAENYKSHFRSFHVKLEGTQVTNTPIGSMPLNEFRKYGPFQVTVQDGELNLDLIKVTGDPMISGMAVHKN